MSNTNTQAVNIPDIGGAVDVDVIELLVKAGDTIAVDDPILTLESDKASMEIPSSVAGTIETVHVKVGDKVSEGALMLTVVPAGEQSTSQASKPVAEATQEKAAAEPQAAVAAQSETITVPDIGGTAAVDVIEVNVAIGDVIKQEQSLITLESDKASMEVPSPLAGTVESIAMKVGDKASEGDIILTLKTTTASTPAKSADNAPAPKVSTPTKETAPAPTASKPSTPKADVGNDRDVYAGPAVRQLARELDIDLKQITGTGRKGRIQKEDLTQFVKKAMSGGSANSGLGFDLPPLANIDFAKFGKVTTQPLNRIKKLTGRFLHRNWLTVPHVTQFDEADITELEAFRKLYKAKAEAQGFKLTPIVFVIKAVVAALKAFPQFNASLDETGENVILKSYYHIGVAVDTPNGLVVPVIRDADKKGIYELAAELGEISKKAREKGLTPADMQGGCFSISSLGGIGGTAFTPIVNLPEVAILGLSKSAMKPVYQNGEFVPRLMLPMSLSYDHRVIDGADGARFTRFLADGLADLRLALL